MRPAIAALLLALGGCGPTIVAAPPRAPQRSARRATPRRRRAPPTAVLGPTAAPPARPSGAPAPLAGDAVEAPAETADAPAVVAVRDAFERAARCLPPGGSARVEGGVDPSTGRVVLPRAPDGDAASARCALDALDGVVVDAPLAVRVDFAATVTATSTRAGRVDGDAVRAATAARSGAVVACYERELAHDRGLAGRVEVHVAVEADGVVSRWVAAAPARFGSFGRCLLGALDGMTLPRPEGGAAEATLPFAFSPGDREDVAE